MIVDAFRVELGNEMTELHAKVEREISKMQAKVEHDMSELRSEVRTGLEKLGNGLSVLQDSSSNHNALLSTLCQQSGSSVPPLETHAPLAPTIGEPAALTPSASSAISNISSTSSIPPLGGLTIHSPITFTNPTLPVAGSSAPNRDPTPIEGMSLCYHYNQC